MKKEIIIYGAGGLGREILSWVRTMPLWKLAGFIDDGFKPGTMIDGMEVIGGVDNLNNTERALVAVIIAVGDPNLKSVLVNNITNPAVYFPVLIHPSVIILNKDTVKIGSGTIVSAGTILTTQIEIGDHVLINLKCTVGHDTTIGSYSSMMPGVNVAGGVSIGSQVLVGSGANLMNNIQIANRSTIGMGAVVINNVASETTVVGVPAKPLER
jgi:sugar O-acyltransferase (sialic acid O-acetyltransferase NeuD family)